MTRRGGGGGGGWRRECVCGVLAAPCTAGRLLTEQMVPRMWLHRSLVTRSPACQPSGGLRALCYVSMVS